MSVRNDEDAFISRGFSNWKLVWLVKTYPEMAQNAFSDKLNFPRGIPADPLA